MVQFSVITMRLTGKLLDEKQHLADIKFEKRTALRLVFPPLLRLGARQHGATLERGTAGEAANPVSSGPRHGV